MEEKDIFQQIDEAFENVTVFDIEIEEENFKITSLTEIPAEKIMSFFMEPVEPVDPSEVRSKLKDLMGLVSICLIDPNDIVKFKQLKMRSMMEFLSKWVEQSSDASMGDGEEID